MTFSDRDGEKSLRPGRRCTLQATVNSLNPTNIDQKGAEGKGAEEVGAALAQISHDASPSSSSDAKSCLSGAQPSEEEEK